MRYEIDKIQESAACFVRGIYNYHAGVSAERFPQGQDIDIHMYICMRARVYRRERLMSNVYIRDI